MTPQQRDEGPPAPAAQDPGVRPGGASDAGIDLLYLSSVPTAAQFGWMKGMRRAGAQEVTYGMPEAGFKFHTLVQQGLRHHGARVFSLVGRSATPLFYRGVWWRRVVERPAPDFVVDHRGFPNVRVAKQLWLAVSLALAAARWRSRTRSSGRRRVVVLDAAYVSALPGVLLATRGGGITRIAIVADVYAYMADVGEASDRRGTTFALARAALRRVYRQVDGFVLLTRQMNEVVNPARRPHLVMEGLVDPEVAGWSNELADKDDRPTVLYAGALRREYGLATLVDGFRAVRDPRARLVVYGAGDFVPELERAAAEDPRIDFRGSAPTEEVLRAEERAWVLVNPRPADAEFTKFSFPSKNMEYLASGTAVLTTRLPGMPQEYYDHVLTIDGSDALAMTSALESTLALGLPALHERGSRGRAFVLEHKTNRAQALRILELAEGCG